jgi:hypothetical protein
MDDFRWYMIMITVIMSIIIGGVLANEWHNMDCRLTLVQAGRTVSDIKEICK